MVELVCGWMEVMWMGTRDGWEEEWEEWEEEEECDVVV